MINPRYHKALAIGLVAAGIVGWIALSGFLTRFHDGAETLAIASPSSQGEVIIPPGARLVWQGRANTIRDCNAGTLAAQTGRVPLGKGQFVAKSPPIRTYGDQLVWLDINCDGRWETQYARKAIVQPKLQARTDVARVHFQSKKMRYWLQREINPRISRELRGLDGMTFPRERGYWRYYYPKVSYIRSDGVNLRVDNGFWLVGNLRGKIQVTCKSRRWPDLGRSIVCPFNIDIKGRVQTRITVSKGWRVNLLDTRIRLSDFKVDGTIANWALDKSDVSKPLNKQKPKIEGAIRDQVQKQLDKFVSAVTKSTGPMVVKWLEKENIVKRLVEFAKGADFRFTNGNSVRNGEDLYFSVSVSSKWLRRQGPRLLFSTNKQSRKHPIGLVVSYALINRALEAFLSRDVSAVLREVSVGAKAFGMGGLAKLEFGNVSTLGGHGHDFNRFLSRIGVRYDDSLSFRLPVSLRPLGNSAVRFSVADSRMFLGTGAQRDVSIGVWSEGNIGFARRTTVDDINHLTQHLGFEPVALDASSVSPSTLKRYRATFGLANRILRGENGWTQGGDVPFDLEKMKAALVDLLKNVTFKLPTTLPLDARGNLKFRLHNILNDEKRYSVVVHGRLLGTLP